MEKANGYYIVVPKSIKDKTEVEEREMDDDDNFIFSETSCKNIKESLEKILSGEITSEDHFPNKVLELKEIFFFFEKVFPEEDKINNPLKS